MDSNNAILFDGSSSLLVVCEPRRIAKQPSLSFAMRCGQRKRPSRLGPV
jgi:hypothetical protein